jgi:hypothetical protein
MRNAIRILFTATAGFAVTELAASTVYRSTALNDPPLAYYLLGEAPGSPLAIDSSASAPDEVDEETSTLGVAEWNAPFTIEAWVQPLDDYAGLSGARGVLGDAADYNSVLRPAQIGSRYQVEAPFETLTLLGLALILFGSIPRRRRKLLKFRGSDAWLSRARIFRVGGVRLRRRSEPELNSFSACYATTSAPEQAPLAGRRFSAVFRRRAAFPQA